MRLLIVTQSVNRNDPNLGAFHYWFDLLAKKADDLEILASRVGDVSLPPNTRIYTLGENGRGGWRLGRLWKFWALFSGHFREADAVLFHQIPEFVIAAAPFLLGRKSVAALWYAHGAVSWRLRLAERLVDYVFTSSETGFRIPSKKVLHLGQAINPDLFKPKTQNPHPPPKTLVGDEEPKAGISLITVGRISPVKHCETIIEACAILRETWDREWTLSMVGGPISPGDYVYADKIKTLVREKGLESRIRFYGERPYGEIVQILQEHDMLLNTSRTGSLDKAVLEAMACGLTVITSNEGYRPILPTQYFLERVTPESLAERTRALADEPRPNTALREIVVGDHALEHTIDELYAALLTKV